MSQPEQPNKPCHPLPDSLADSCVSAHELLSRTPEPAYAATLANASRWLDPV